MADEFISRSEYSECVHRIDDENDRQNKRIQKLEDSIGQLSDLTSSVKVLAVNIDTMSKELTKQGEKLDQIEAKPAQNWEKLVWAVGGVVVAAIVAFVLKQIGL